MERKVKMLFKLEKHGTITKYDTRFIDDEEIRRLAEREKEFIKHNLTHDVLQEMRLQNTRKFNVKQ